MRWLIALPLIFISCKKDKLEGDKSILIGEWEWVYTEKWVDYCDPDYMYFDTITPITKETTWQIKFLEKGKVQFYQENELLMSHRVVFVSFGCPNCCLGYTSSFEIALDNDPESRLDGCVALETLKVAADFPYPDNEVFISGQCYLTTSYFVRK